jgi:protein-S-isoprenylcysteine O-methyltransferase Ste14
MILLFLVVWAVDSFLLNRTTFLASSIPLSVRVLLGISLVGAGGYLGWSAHESLFGDESGSKRLLDSGVFGICRHPLYLGVVVSLLGLSVTTLSLASMAVLTVFFLLYDRFASFEETKLLQAFGEEYREYQRRVPKWFLR